MSKSVDIKQFLGCHGIGIDVSKAELVLGAFKGKKQNVCRVTNNRSCVESALKRLLDAGFDGQLICESTGHYHLLLVLVCHELGIPLVILNPLMAVKHSKSKVRKLKSDPTDALTLSTMLVTEPNLPEPSQLDENQILVRLKQGQLASIEKQIQTMRRSAEQYQQTYEWLGLSQSSPQQEIANIIKQLERTKRSLSRELEHALKEIAESDEAFRDLKQLPGFSDMVTGLVLNFDRNVASADSWVAYVGMDISVRQSGTWKGRGKLTKRGNGYLRKRLFQAAWGAFMHYDYVRNYYDQLKQKGRNHKEALTILARKLLKIAYQIVVCGVKYDKNVAFPTTDC